MNSYAGVGEWAHAAAISRPVPVMSFFGAKKDITTLLTVRIEEKPFPGVGGGIGLLRNPIQ